MSMPASAGGNDVRARNRMLVRVLLGVVGTLVVASFLVGIRW